MVPYSNNLCQQDTDEQGPQDQSRNWFQRGISWARAGIVGQSPREGLECGATGEEGRVAIPDNAILNLQPRPRNLPLHETSISLGNLDLFLAGDETSNTDKSMSSQQPGKSASTLGHPAAHEPLDARLHVVYPRRPVLDGAIPPPVPPKNSGEAKPNGVSGPLLKVEPQEFADGFKENPLTGSPATDPESETFYPFRKETVEQLQQLGLSSVTTNSVPSQRAKSRVSANAQHGSSDHLHRKRESLPPMRDTHKIVVGTDDDYPSSARIQRVTGYGRVMPPSAARSVNLHTAPKSTPGQNGTSLRQEMSKESMLAIPPRQASRAQTSRTYMPYFLKPGSTVAEQSAPNVEDAFGNPAPLASTPPEGQIAAAAQQGKASVPGFLRPGWGELPRAAPECPRKNDGPVRERATAKHHRVELPPSSPQAGAEGTPVPNGALDKVRDARRSWSRPWRKRAEDVDERLPTKQAKGSAMATIVEQHATQETSSTARSKLNHTRSSSVTLAECGPASIMSASLFPSSVMAAAAHTPAKPTTLRPIKPYRPVMTGEVPSTLRVGHNEGSIHDANETDSPTYKWPLVDLRDGLFLNFDPKKSHTQAGPWWGLKHQEPRIAGLQFEEDSLHELERAALMNKSVAADEAREIVAAASPVSPPSEHGSPIAREMMSRKVRPAPIAPQRHRRTQSEMVEIRSSSFLMSQQQHGCSLDQTVKGPVVKADSPETTEGRDPKEREDSGDNPSRPDFSWFRFSRADLEDPCDVHCRDYRDRRREQRRSKLAGA